jgi:hypothetical protein
MKIHLFIIFSLFSFLCHSQKNDSISKSESKEVKEDINTTTVVTVPKKVIDKKQGNSSQATLQKQKVDVQFNTLICKAEILFTQKKIVEAKNKFEEALTIKPNQKDVILKIAEIDAILNIERLDKIEQAKIDSLLSIALNYQNEKKFDSAKLVYKNELLKDNQKAKEGLFFCESQITQKTDIIGSSENHINSFKYLFFFTCFLILLLLILLLIIYKRMDKYKSKYSEARISLSENISNFRNTIVSFNSLLKSLGKEEEIVLKYNEVKTIDDMPIRSIEDLFQDFNYELSSIAKQANHIESEHLKNKTVLDKIESEASMPVSQLAEKYKETVLELNKVKDELKNKSNSSNATVNLDVPHFEIPDGIFINSNILVSPGPRKDKDNDTELGEDATGILNTQYGTFFWILDGTSDSPSIVNDKEHIFSSRILAQLMNKNIREELIQKSNEKINLKEILISSVESSKKDLIEKLKNSSNDILEKIASNIKSNNIPFCSTTVLIGFLSKQGTLQYFYLGDSEVLSFYNDGTKFIANDKDKNENPSRLFISILMDENSFVLKTNSFDEKLVVYKKENIDLVVAFSDGIRTSEKSLLVNPALSLSKISLVNQLTYDDKTLLVLERTKNRNQ